MVEKRSTFLSTQAAKAPQSSSAGPGRTRSRWAPASMAKEAPKTLSWASPPGWLTPTTE
ncbi:MAG: hypothetical protein IPI35_19910 [Deltaproteobacteria bacterium]|nr:hypothetical protein [Deltaproteobacteria bacterium]